ncbi:hypothetical protein QTP88_025376 [Uroleucon formosanum]
MVEEKKREITQINQPSSHFVSDLTDPEASSSSEKVSSVEGEQELLFENDVGIYLENPLTETKKNLKFLINRGCHLYHINSL